MEERLQKILSARGVASRREAEKIINAGRVTVNGKLAAVGDKADPEKDEIEIDGVALPGRREHVYIMLNKPRGYVTTVSDDRGRPTVMDLVSGSGHTVYPVGRLDMDSEGLLLLTNDGDFAQRNMHPRFEKKKTYRVDVAGFTKDSIERLKTPIEIDGYLIRAPEVTLLHSSNSDAMLEICIYEGRNRQVRRMCDAGGLEVKRLVRVAYGGVVLGVLKSGEWRYLIADEIQKLTE
jgi:23S rRNA pseudouridine2605 synthase